LAVARPAGHPLDRNYQRSNLEHESIQQTDAFEGSLSGDIIMTASKKIRLDELLVERGLVESRSQAKSLIMSGRVLRGTERLDKPGKEFPLDLELTIEQPPRFVSRGGEKLAAALEHFALNVQGAHVLDVGASTGGFTDCVLQAGAADVVCVDVGRAQLHAKLRGDPRVTNLEKINARHLSASDLPRSEFDLVVMDLSFISLKSVLPAVWPMVRSQGILVALVKPQFEAGKTAVDKGRGVIRDEAVQAATLAGVRDFALTELPNATLVGTIDSPITGADGNREFLLVLRKTSGANLG
jgi:23S rRNA (cytidine1920-2'-O)/16S rRNA (cytidine1409-2'-O)-methyltransferase